MAEKTEIMRDTVCFQGPVYSRLRKRGIAINGELMTNSIPVFVMGASSMTEDSFLDFI